MKEPELKDNLCVVKFICIESNSEDCVHHKNKKQCKFFIPDRFVCTNSIAQVQAISRYLKHIGLSIKGE